MAPFRGDIFDFLPKKIAFLQPTSLSSENFTTSRTDLDCSACGCGDWRAATPEQL